MVLNLRGKRWCRSVPFLASSVPDVKLDGFVFALDISDFEIHPDCREERLVEKVVRESQEDV